MSERDREPTRLPREEFDAQLRHAGEAALGDASLIADEEREAVLARMFGEGARERRLGHYSLRKHIGAGGMGTVYRARDRRDGREVALKILRDRGDPRGEERMLREAYAMSKLSSPHVVRLYEVGVIDGQVYLAMELIRGRTLRTWLEEQPRTWAEIVEMFVRAGRGLCDIHRAGLVHRDFKPGNVLVDDADDRPRLVDFGLVRNDPREHDDPQLQRVTATGEAMGTRRYMSPEQRLRSSVDNRSDQYSFCLSLFEAVYGCHPLASGRTAHGDPDGIRLPKGDATAPSAVWSVLRRGLSREPDERWSSMEVLLAALIACRGLIDEASAGPYLFDRAGARARLAALQRSDVGRAKLDNANRELEVIDLLARDAALAPLSRTAAHAILERALRRGARRVSEPRALDLSIVAAPCDRSWAAWVAAVARRAGYTTVTKERLRVSWDELLRSFGQPRLLVLLASPEAVAKERRRLDVGISDALLTIRVRPVALAAPLERGCLELGRERDGARAELAVLAALRSRLGPAPPRREPVVAAWYPGNSWRMTSGTWLARFLAQRTHSFA
ncbi:MAG: serine/threonine-protein kinase [Nannocystaceae bacterium]|nr:serine/threonine protein kinase [Myxococcales bacterium]